MDELLKRYPIISDQVTASELNAVLRELRGVLATRVDGDVVELGCFVGTTSLFLQRVLAGSGKTLHVYDSFAGLPPKVSADQSPSGTQFTQGELAATKKQLITNFKHAGLPQPVIHKGWFEQLSPTDMPPRVCFAYLDGDFYTSILASLKLVWPRLQPGAVVVVDDYHHEALPGVERALKEWSVDHSFSIRPEASLAIIRPQAPVSGA